MRNDLLSAVTKRTIPQKVVGRETCAKTELMYRNRVYLEVGGRVVMREWWIGSWSNRPDRKFTLVPHRPQMKLGTLMFMQLTVGDLYGAKCLDLCGALVD